MRLLHGDAADEVGFLEDCSVDAMVTDPPAGISFMGKAWDADKGGRDKWIEWLSGVFRECLRVMKPGAHGLVWALPRTSHWTATALEDAGFEVRDVVTHHFGTGFPKSLNVGKAIDKQRYDRAEILKVTGWIAEARDRAGSSNADIDAAFGFHGMAGHWTSSKSQPAVPTLDQVPKLLDMLGVQEVPEELRELLIDLNGKKGQPGENWFKREKIGEETVMDTTHSRLGFAAMTAPDGKSRSHVIDVTASATDAAKQWEGFGTALKPAAEMWILIRKPEGVDEQCRVLEEGLITRIGEGEGSSGQTDTSRSESVTGMSLSIVSSWRATLAALSEVMSTCTTETGSSLTTDLKTLSCCLAEITPENIIQAVSNPSGATSSVLAAVNLFVALQARYDATRVLSARGNATDKATSSEESASVSPVIEAGFQTGLGTEHAILVRKPLGGTVAANVLEHGTGALNIDGCRITTAGGSPAAARRASSRKSGNAPMSGKTAEESNAEGKIGRRGSAEVYSQERPSEQLGRWPANLVLSHSPDCGEECASGCPVAELDRQSGDRPGFSSGGTKGAGFREQYVGGENKDRELVAQTYGDSGGASRFFYVAKPSKKERGAGNDHPTVKSVTLMRYLCRLITPPGGTVLDPFMGSGTTGLACVQEGFDFVGIEQDEHNHGIAVKRLAEWDF